MKPKVLLASTQVFPVPPNGYGGVELIVYLLSKGLKEYEPWVLAPQGSQVPNLIPTPLGSPESTAYEIALPKLKEFDLIHSHTWEGHFYLQEVPVIHTIHGPRPWGSPPPVPKPCLVCASKVHGRYIKEVYGVEVEVVYHGIPVEEYPYEDQKEDFLLYLARVSPEKGALQFVELCRELGVRGYLCGGDRFVMDREYVWKVMKACEESGLVRYMGEVPRDLKLELLKKARCLVSPLQEPYMEVFGIATVEALACGTPVVSTNRGAAQEILTPEVGYVGEDLKEGVRRKYNPRECRARAEEFSVERMCREYEALYNRVRGGDRW